MKIKLDGVAETLLITLNARAKDYENPKSVLHDKKSFEIASTQIGRASCRERV